MGFCVVVNCGNNSFRKKGITFYRLPKDEALKKRWLANIKRENLPKEIRLCHFHFEETCFKHDIEVCKSSLVIFTLRISEISRRIFCEIESIDSRLIFMLILFVFNSCAS